MVVHKQEAHLVREPVNRSFSFHGQQFVVRREDSGAVVCPQENVPPQGTSQVDRRTATGESPPQKKSNWTYATPAALERKARREEEEKEYMEQYSLVPPHGDPGDLGDADGLAPDDVGGGGAVKRRSGRERGGEGGRGHPNDNPYNNNNN
jgi:hypothetical protein